MALDVKVNISLLKPVGEPGFGYPLILTVGESAKAYTECSSLEEIVEAGYAATTDVYKAAALMLAQDTIPETIAVCTITALNAANLSTLTKKGWRQLLVVGVEDVSAAATYVTATQDKILFVTVPAASGLNAYKGNERVYGLVHTNSLAAAAIIGESTRQTVGSITYKNLILNGVEAMDFDDEAIAAIHAANGNTILEKAGDIVTSEGLTMSGEYLDIIDCRDYIVSQIEYNTQKTLNNLDKIPYDTSGIKLLEGVARDVLRRAWTNGIILTNGDGSPAFSTRYALREECKDTDIAARKYIEGKFAFTLTGAIHSVVINGEISVA